MSEPRDLHPELIEVYLSLFRLREEGSMRPQVNVQELLDNYRKLLSLRLTTVFPELLTLDLSLAQVNVLFWLETRGVSTLGDVVDQFELTLSHASRLIDHLIQAELVASSGDAEDRRRTYIELTSQGRALIESLLASLEQRSVVLLQGLDEDEQGALVRGFQVILRVIRKVSNKM